MNWIPLVTSEQVEIIQKRSKTIPCLIYKHSTTCDLSALSRIRLEEDWDFKEEELECYFLDLLSHKKLSQLVAEHFFVEHESPQVLLIRDGFCTYDADHLDISVEELKECYDSKF